MLIRIAKEPYKKYYELFVNGRPVASDNYNNLIYHLETLLAFEEPTYDATGENQYVNDLEHWIVAAVSRICDFMISDWKVIEIEFDHNEEFYRFHFLFNGNYHVKGVAYGGIIDEESIHEYRLVTIVIIYFTISRRYKMEIIKMFPEDLNKREQYKLMKSPSVNRMQDAEGSVLEVAAWIDYNDVDLKTGEVREILTIKTVDGEMFGTISPTFQKEFKEIVEYFGDDVGMIRVITGQSKSGKKFVTCAIE